MTIPAVSPTYTPVISSVPISPDSLDATSIVSYCVSRLNSLDQLIKDRFADQQKRNDGIKEASALVNQLDTFPAGVAEGAGATDGSDKDYAVHHRDMGVALANQFAAATDPGVRAKIVEFYKLTTGRDLQLGPDGKPTPAMTNANADPNVYLDRSQIHALDNNAWQAKIGDVKSLQDGLTKDNELSMISLQSVVSQRQLAVQMTTQLLSTMNETSKQVLGNLK